MALLFMDSFDHYATADITQKYTATNQVPEIVAGGRSSNGLKCNVGGEYISATILIGLSEVVIGVAIKVSALPDPGRQSAVLTVGSTSYWETALVLQSDGTFRTARSGTGLNMEPGNWPYLTLVGASTSQAIQTNVWVYLEWKVAVDGTTGSSVVRINGVEVLSESNINTLTSTTALTRFALGWNGNGQILFDDLYVASTSGGSVTDFLGDVTVECLLPQTDAVDPGSYANWSCSSGSPEDHGAEVNDATPDGDSTYVYTASNLKESWNYPDLSVPNATIHGIQVSTNAKKSASGTAEFKNLVDLTPGSPSSENQGANTHAPSDSAYAYYRDLWEVNPDDSSPWTVSDINSAEFGVERTA